MESVRQSKVARLIQKDMAELLRAESKNLFGGAFITVTVVRVTPDLGLAKIYLSIMGTKDKEVTLKAVKSNGVVLRKKLGMMVGKQLRIVPELNYYIDDSLDYAMRIEELLKKS